MKQEGNYQEGINARKSKMIRRVLEKKFFLNRKHGNVYFKMLQAKLNLLDACKNKAHYLCLKGLYNRSLSKLKELWVELSLISCISLFY
jgi:hypothetical protein